MSNYEKSNYIIANCKLCGIAHGHVDPETLICRDCLVCRRRDTAQLEMAEIADLSAGIAGFVQQCLPNSEFQVKALLYSAAALISANKMNLEQMKIFLNCCVYEFESIENGHQQTKSTKPMQ